MKAGDIADKLGDIALNGTWLWFHTNRYGKELMIELVKHRIETHGDFEINDDYTKFRRIIPFSEFIKGVPQGISFTIEHRNQDEVHFDYSHLEVDIKSYSSADWKKKVGRHV